MAHGFVRDGDDFETRLEPIECTTLRQLLAELTALLAVDGDDRQSSTDPLAKQLGLEDLDQSAVVAPADPVLARLLPDGYSDDDDAAAEFRRFTDSALRRGKQQDAATVLAGIDQAEADEQGSVSIDEPTAMAWMRSINDLRLALGVQLEIDDDLAADLSSIPDDDPRAASAAIYEFLTWWQDTLVNALMD